MDQNGSDIDIIRPLFLAAMGASAGGVTSLKNFFSAYSNSPQISLMLIQHLDANGTHLAHEFLSTVTDLPILEVKNGLRYESGNLYLVPPHSIISIEEDLFTVRPAQEKTERHAVIDFSFRNLAEALGKNMVGILLSGEGSDGTHGLKAVHEQGGMVMAQAPESCEHPSMPHTAILSGIVDHILRPNEMPAELASYEKYVARMFSKTSVAELRDQIGASLISICDILEKATHHDFKHYKTSTLIRRIQRRMQVLQLNSVEAYVEKISLHGEEVNSLFKELLINVTSFFRDPESIAEVNREVIEKCFANRPTDQKFRMWVAGCSTGEEVYTFAILLREQLEKFEHPPEVQIIATDIDEQALNIARKGIYPVGIEEHVSKERLSKYFIKRGGKYHVSKDLRELCLFSSHNLINDPPFSQLDLISCRNVIIYLGTHLQKKLVPVFHYALKTNGYLFLGTSETLSTHRELFKIVSAKHRIAQRKATAIRPQTSFSTHLSYSPHFKDAAQSHEADIHLVSQRIILDEFAPKYAIVNDEGQIVSVSAGLNQYLEPSEGSFQNNIVKLVKPSLRMALRATLAEAAKHKRKVDHEYSTLKTEEVTLRIGLTVQPMPKLGEDSSLYMVVFHRLGRINPVEETDSGSSITTIDSDFVDQLEQELLITRQDLDKTVQDLEASNEELKSSNEELLSMNEELQSANEELETSKEEVQDSNEALQRANSDLENLLASTNIATLFLDNELRIKSFTPALAEIYRIQETDLGRDIADFTSRAIQMPEFPDPQSVLLSSDVHEAEVRLPDGRIFLRRILPYRTHTQKQDGMVVTFIDVTELRTTQMRVETMIKTSPAFMCVLSGPDYIYEQANERYQQLVGRTDLIGKKVLELLPEVEGQGFIELLNQVRRTGQPFIGTETPLLLKRSADRAPEKRYLDFVYQPEQTSDGKMDRIFVHGNDVTEKVHARAAIENERSNFRNLFKQTPEMVCILTGPNHLFEFTNEAHVRVLGFDATGMTVREAQPESIEVHGILDEVYQSGVTAELNEISVTIGNRARYFNLTYAARRNNDNVIDGVMILGTEITEQVFNRFELEKARNDAEMASEAKSIFLANMSHEIRTPLSAIMGFSDLLTDSFAENSVANSYVARIKRNSSQLGRLVDEFLDLSKIEAKRLEVERVPVNINSAIEDTFAAVSLQAKEKGLSFNVKRLSDIPETAITDPTRFRQILINLAGNAIKFTDSGNVIVELMTTKRDEQNFLKVRVTDTGIGLSESQQENLFQPFHQADNSITRKYGGTGLGLALSRDLARLLNGDIVLEKSAVNQGSVFVLTVSLGTDAEIAETERKKLKIPEGQTPVSLRGARILVVDDSPDNQELITLYLDQAEAEYELANDGTEAVKKVMSGHYDLVLMDLQMPKMDGYTALDTIRKGQATVPVIALTAHALKSERDKCFELGFNDYVTKPINFQQLLDAMKRLIKEPK